MSKIVLPPLSLNMLTKSQLCELIPELIKTVTGTEPPQFTPELRPLWWPDDIPWTTLASMLQLPSCEISSTELKRVVRCCYYHSGNEQLLSSEDAGAKLSSKTTELLKGFNFSLDMPVASPTSSNILDKDSISVMGLPCPQRSLNKYSGHFTRGQRQMFNAYLQKKQQEARVPVRKLPKWDDSKHPVRAWWVRKRTRKVEAEVHPSRKMRQEEFLCGCGLVTNISANRLKHEADAGLDIDLDCQIIAVEGPLSVFGVRGAAEAGAPRTPKSLMSQLSRDSAAAAKKRISFCVKEEEGSGNDSETNASATSSDMKQGSLFTIDFSSLLGQRLKKHMQSEVTVPVIRNPEDYCRTDVQQDGGKKLRHRASDYPVTFRKKKAVHQRQCHMLKLTGGERREFLQVLKTGLDKRSRHLQRQMKTCAIKLRRLSRKEIRYWTIRRRTIINQEIHIDDDISIMQVDIPESSYPAVCHKLPIAAAEALSHGDARYIHTSSQGIASYTFQGLGASNRLLPFPGTQTQSFLNPRPASPPFPQFLVKKVSKNFNGQESQRLVYVPLADGGLPEPAWNLSSPTPTQTGSMAQSLDPLVRGATATVSKGVPTQTGSMAQSLDPLVHGATATVSKGVSVPPSVVSNNKKSRVPEYRRLGPKSRRQQLLAQREGRQERGSATSNMLDGAGVSEKLPQKRKGDVPHPVAVVSGSRMPVLLDIQSDTHTVVPQVLHIARSVSNPDSVLDNSPAFLPQMFPITDVTLLPGQDVSAVTRHKDVPDSAPPSEGQVSKERSVSKEFPQLAQQLQAGPLQAVSQLSESCVDGGETNQDSAQDGDGELALSIGAVYSASDLCNQQLLSSLGLVWETQSPPETVGPPLLAETETVNIGPLPHAATSAMKSIMNSVGGSMQQRVNVTRVERLNQTPNILLSPLAAHPVPPQTSLQPCSLQSQPGSHLPRQRVTRRVTPLTHGPTPTSQSSKRVSFHNAAVFAPVLPSHQPPAPSASHHKVSQSNSQVPSRQTASRSESLTSRSHPLLSQSISPAEVHANIREVMGPKPVAVELPPVPPPLIKRAPPIAKPAQDSRQRLRTWRVVNAMDDDVVEIICIDD